MTLKHNNKRVDLPVVHVAAKKDRYFDNTSAEQHMREIFSDFKLMYMKEGLSHAPTVIATSNDAAPFIPPELRKMLNKKQGN
jgi:hypothetical protein